MRAFNGNWELKNGGPQWEAQRQSIGSRFWMSVQNKRCFRETPPHRGDSF